MVIRLDRIDVGIIELLQTDGRMMYKDIARQTGVSLPTVRARIRRLTDLGVIKKFTVIVDPDKIRGKIRTILLIQANPPEVEQVHAKLSEMKEFREVYGVAGSFAILAKAEVSDIAELGKLTAEKLLQVKGITNINSLLITKTPKEEYGATVLPEDTVVYKCDFCGLPIEGKPIVEWINNVRYRFGAEQCAGAFKEKLLKKQVK